MKALFTHLQIQKLLIVNDWSKSSARAGINSHQKK